MLNVSKLKGDLAFNYLSLIVLGASGLVINFLIGRFVGAGSLGVFSQLFTIYIVVSQFSVLGIQFSLLTYLSKHRVEKKEYDDLIFGALIAAFVTSVLVVLPLYIWKESIAGVFSSVGVEQGIVVIFPAIFLFGINKVQINILNGLEEMKLFGFFQALRMLLILVFVSAFIFLDFGDIWITASITIAESLVFILLIGTTSRFYSIKWSYDLFRWFLTHISFGLRGLMNGAVSEVNSRVDVIIIGIFMSDAAVGVYTMASTVVEGVMQIPAIVRNVINPILSKYWLAGSRAEFLGFLKSLVKNFYCVFLVLALLSLPAYYVLITFFVGSEFDSSVSVFLILMFGVTLASGFMPLDMLPIQLGFPITQSAYKAAVALVNVLLNLLLIERYGLVGVAIGTSISFVVGALLLGAITRRIINSVD